MKNTPTVILMNLKPLACKSLYNTQILRVFYEFFLNLHTHESH